MSVSSGEHSIRQFKLDKMAAIVRRQYKKKEEDEEEAPRVRGRSSFFSIPPPKLDKIYQQIFTTPVVTKEQEEEKKKEEKLNEQLCNSYRMVVNYGVFESNFEWLPNELLIHIFQYLNTRDLLTAGLVCQKWLEATQYVKLCRRMLLHLQVFKYSDTAYPMNRFLNCSRNFPNMKFSIVKFTPKNDAFWELYGDMLEELTFNSCLINKPEFLRIMRLCPNLRMLSITRCDDLYKSWSVVKKISSVRLRFSEMKTLEIRETSLITKQIFNFMVYSMPHLTSLTLENCFGNMKACDRVQLLDAIIDFISRHSKQIKKLNLLNTQTDDMFLEKLSSISALKLDELRLSFNGVISTLPNKKNGMLELLRHQKDLRVLDLMDSKGLSNLCLMEICKWMKDLKVLILKRCWLINDAGLKEVGRLLNLEVLDITSCDRVTDLGLLEGLIPKGKSFFGLKELYLSLLPYMSIAAVYRLSQQYDELQVLDLSGSSNSVNDEALQMIFRYQLKLKHLNLDCCAKISDFGITGLSDHSEEGNCDNYVPYTINNLKKLRYLNIAGCYQITDKSFIKTFDLPELKEINLSRCHNVTEVGIKSLCKKCPYIEIIDLSENLNVKDSTVEMLSRDATRMETLKINGCSDVSDSILCDLAYNCKYLKNLYIRRCPKIQSNPFQVLSNVRYIYNQ